MIAVDWLGDCQDYRFNHGHVIGHVLVCCRGGGSKNSIMSTARTCYNPNPSYYSFVALYPYFHVPSTHTHILYL